MKSTLNDIMTRQERKPTTDNVQDQQPQQGQQPQSDNVITDKVFNAMSAADVTQHRAAEAAARKKGLATADKPTLTNSGNAGDVANVENAEVMGKYQAVPSRQREISPLDNIEEDVSKKGDAAIKELGDSDRRMSMSDIIKFLNKEHIPTAEEQEREKKKEKRDKLFASISDGISALSNLYFTTQYAPNSYDRRTSAAREAERRWQITKRDRDARMNAYINNLMNAKKLDDADRERKRKWKYLLGVQEDKRNKDKGELALKNKAEDNKQALAIGKLDETTRNHKANEQLTEDKNNETIRNHKANESIAAAKVSEAARHNGVTEAQGAARLQLAINKANRSNSNGSGGNGSGGKGKGKGYNTIRLNDGKVYSYDAKKTGAIISLGGAMQKKAQAAADRYRKAGDFKNAKYYMDIARSIGAAKSNDALSSLVSKHIGEFPSLDNDVRGIIGAPKKTHKAAPTKTTKSNKHSNLNSLMSGW